MREHRGRPLAPADDEVVFTLLADRLLAARGFVLDSASPAS